MLLRYSVVGGLFTLRQQIDAYGNWGRISSVYDTDTVRIFPCPYRAPGIVGGVLPRAALEDKLALG